MISLVYSNAYYEVHYDLDKQVTHHVSIPKLLLPIFLPIIAIIRSAEPCQISSEIRKCLWLSLAVDNFAHKHHTSRLV